MFGVLRVASGGRVWVWGATRLFEGYTALWGDYWVAVGV